MTASAAPLVSAILPTYNRRRFLPHAIQYFLNQDYPNRELIVVDDGTDPVGDLVPAGSGIRYLRLNRRHALGAKRNLACQEANGDIVLHWDDDDWAAPWRIRYQVEELESKKAVICGLDRLYYYEPDTKRAWEYKYSQKGRPWVSGNTFCYRKVFWKSHHFPAIDIAEDSHFVWQVPPQDVLRLDDSRFIVAFIHKSNISPKVTSGCYWAPQPLAVVHSLMGSDLQFDEPSAPPYCQSVAALPESGSQFPDALLADCAQRDLSMTYARKSDLSLPEFVAYRDGVNLPYMRTWELPRALFAARLTDTMSVLDCTINPSGFGERLAELYPHVLYRHWNPTRGGTLSLPSGFPDHAFDRVFCINTLEHLLAPQRQALVSDLARKLKPGGRLILTGDYYFDSFWSRPDILKSGSVRADHAEVFNGFNKVTANDWVNLCQPHGLRLVSDLPDEPREDDPALFRNLPPYPHATIAAVFEKQGPEIPMPSFRILLSLLTWNTRQASIESLNAYLHEADMLERMGHHPMICVCDNGSNDGTREALRRLDGNLRFPHKFVLNSCNLGSSVGRNQIIQNARDVDADYVLFMDGDIEIVPFSSFAMLRYLETNGERVGCIGAYSLGQTPIRAGASKSLFSINPQNVQSTSLVSWTQYGMFRRAVFEDNIQFDESGPFGGPGWGYEDNDLAFQMEMKQYRNDYFSGMTYLHRNVRSSVLNLRRAGLNADQLCQARRQYLLDKWANQKVISDGPLDLIRRSHIGL